MSIIDVWGNSFVPLLAGIPLLVLVLFACCTCVDKTIVALRKSYIFYRCKPRTPRRVRFDCEALRSRSQNYPRLTRSSTSPRLSGLMAHSSYLQRNSNYRFNSVVHSDRSAGPIQARTVLDRDVMSSSLPVTVPHTVHTVHNHSQHGHNSHHTSNCTPNNTSSNHSNVVGYHTNRRSSTPTPTGASPSAYYSIRPKSPFETCVTQIDPKQRRYSTPSSPTTYAYGSQGRNHSPRPDDSNHSSISYLPEVRAYLQFMEVDPSSRQRSHSFSGRNSSRSSSRRSSRRSSRHRARSRSPSPYALERTAMVSASEEICSNYSNASSYGRYLTPQGSSDQGSFRSPESGTPDWLDALEDVEIPQSFKDSLSNLSRSSSIRTSFI